MGAIRRGSVGILPAGALGVAFFYHLTHGATKGFERVSFLIRSASRNSAELYAKKELHLEVGGVAIDLDEAGIWQGTLFDCARWGRLPEVVLVCTQPDQLLPVVEEFVLLFETQAGSEGVEQAVRQMPALVLCSNGIYFQRVRQFLIEKLEDATLMGRLPDLWPDIMPQIVGRFLRGVTIQTGQRAGYGGEARYQPGPRGRTRIAGGNVEVRRRCAKLLDELGGWFEAVPNSSPTRVEFDKALVNLSVNLLGQLMAIDDEGIFRPLRIAQILGENDARARELVANVIEVGRAVRAYSPTESFEEIWRDVVENCRLHLDHVPSSLQWIQLQIAKGSLDSNLSPTERWLLEPLIKYAHAAGLENVVTYFEKLRAEVEARLLLAARAGGKQKSEAG